MVSRPDRIADIFVLLITGGRDYSDAETLYSTLDEILAQVKDRDQGLRIVHGGAKGADSLADQWATERGVYVTRVPADWNRQGRQAGFLRNQRMLDDYPIDGVLAFPGGTGTADMVSRAQKAQIPVRRIRGEEPEAGIPSRQIPLNFRRRQPDRGRPYKVIQGIKVPTWVNELSDWYGSTDAELAQIADDDRARKIQFTLRRAQAMNDNIPEDLGKYFWIANINTPEGQVVNSLTGQTPSYITPVQSNSGWELILQDVENPITGEPFRFPAGIRINNKGEFAKLDREDREGALLRLYRYLRREGFTTYSLTTQGNQSHRMFWGTFDPDAPLPVDFDLERAAGFYIPAVDEATREIKDDVAGKHFKRTKMYGFSSEGETVTFSRTRYENYGERGILNFQGDGGAAMASWTVVDDVRTTTWVDSAGVVHDENPANVTDGAGDGRRRKLAQIYRAQTGRDLPPDVHGVQINGVIDQGDGTSRMVKVYMHIIPDSEYVEMQRRDGFSTDMRISSDSLATQHGNLDAQDWRMIWHKGKKDIWEWRPSDGLLNLPALKRYMDLEDVAKMHFGHFISDSFYAADDAERMASTLAGEYEKLQPEGLTEYGRVDPGDATYDENLREKSVLEQRFERNRVAIATGSPYASVGAMEALANKEKSIIQKMRSRGGGAPGLMTPVFQGEQTPKINLPGDIETQPGMVRMIVRRFRTPEGMRYSHHIVFDEADMTSQDHLIQHSGPDSDGDKFNAIVGEDPETGKLYARVSRSPLSSDASMIYDVHEDDVAMLRRRGYPILPFKDGMATAGPLVPDKYEFFKTDGMKPELSDRSSALLKDIAVRINSGTPAESFLAKIQFDSIVTGQSEIGLISNLVGHAMHAGWVDSPEDWRYWVSVDVSNSLDVEINGGGTNHQTADELLEKTARALMRGIPGDRGLLTTRVGMFGRIVDKAVEISGYRRNTPEYWDFRDNFISTAMDNAGVHADWQEAYRIFDGTERAVAAIENARSSTANGPREWMLARVQNTPPRRGRHILREVDQVAQRLSGTWRRMYGQNLAYLETMYEELGLQQLTHTNIAKRKELDARANKNLWAKLDAIFADTLEEVRQLPGYQDGMLQGSFVQQELTVRSFHNRPGDERWQEGRINEYDHLRPRVMQSFDEVEQRGYFNPVDDVNIPPTIVVEYEGEPWMAENRRTGQKRDMTGSRQGYSQVRFEGRVPGVQTMDRLGPFTWIRSPHAGDQLQKLADMGYEFRYVGNVKGIRENNLGIFQLERTQNAISEASMARWFYWRYVQGIPSVALPPIWTPIEEMDNFVFEYISAAGRRVLVTDDDLYVQMYDNGRTEFPDYDYSMPMPEDLRQTIGMERALDRDLDLLPEGQPSPEQGGALPVDERPKSNIDRTLASMRDEVRTMDYIKKTGINREQRENPEYKRTDKFDDPTLEPVKANRVGGRSDADVLMVSLFEEAMDVYRYAEDDAIRMYGPRGNYWRTQGQRFDQRRLQLVMDGVPDVIWYSPTLGHFTTTRDVTRAYQDFKRWQLGEGVSPLSSPGLRHAKTNSEAASLVMKDLVMYAEERFIRNREFGYLERIIEDGKVRIQHTRSTTTAAAERVRPAITARLQIAPGFSIHPRIQFTPPRKYLLERWLSDLEIYEPFEGNAERMASATVQEVSEEMAKMMRSRENNTVKMALLNLVERDVHGKMQIAGVPMTAGLTRTASELIDLGAYTGEAFKYVSSLLKDVEANNLETLVRIGLRLGMENTLRGLGIESVNPHDLSMAGRVVSHELEIGSGRIQRSQIGQDYREARAIIHRSRMDLEQGRFGKAAVEMFQLGSLKTVQWARRRTRLYTSFGGVDVSGRSAGRFMATGTERFFGIPLTGYLDVNALVGDRAVNQAIANLKTATNQMLWQLLKETNQELYDYAKRAQLASRGAYRDFSENTGIKFSMIERVVDERYKEDYSRFVPRPGFKVALIARMDWLALLTQGVGASALSGAMAKSNVPVEKRWVLGGPRHKSDEICRRNASQGWMPNAQMYLSGHDRPPAHPYCKCHIQLRVKGTEKIDPTLNGLLRPLVRPRFLNINRRTRRPPRIPMPGDVAIPRDLRPRIPRDLNPL